MNTNAPGSTSGPADEPPPTEAASASEASADEASADQAPTWRETVAVYLHPRVVSLAFLGFSAGLPFLLVFSTMSGWLSEVGTSRTTIGFFSWIGMAYSVKVFWAPIVDGTSLPLFGRLGRRRGWMLAAQFGICAGLVGLALGDPVANLTLFALLGLVVAFSSATQDLTIDAYRIESARAELQAAMAAAYVFGYRMAMLVAGGGAFLIADQLSWNASYLVMAGLVSVGIITTLLVPEPPREQIRRTGKALERLAAWIKTSVLEPFIEFFHRHGWHAAVILGLIACYRLGDLTMGVMANPFYLDHGYTKTEIGLIVKVFGLAMTLLGSFVAGALVIKRGLGRLMIDGAILVAATNVLFAVMAELPPSRMLLATVISADNFSGGFANVVFIAFLSNLTNKSYTAVQYALFSSLMTLAGKFIGGYSGVVVDAVGYMPFFIYAAALGIPAVLCVIWVQRLESKSGILTGERAGKDTVQATTADHAAGTPDR